MPKTSSPKTDPKFNNSLSRGLKVLSAFSPGDQGLSNAELSKRTGISKPTITRLTYTLIELRYLSVSEDSGKYFLHPHILTLGYSVLSQLDIRQVARPLMQELAYYCHGAVSLGMRDGHTMILLERIRDRFGSNLAIDIGSGLDIATSAMGRAYISALPETDRSKLLNDIKHADKKRWPKICPGLDKAMKDYRKFGYCQSAGELIPEVNGVGVPLILKDRSIFAFNCSGLSSSVTREMLPDLGQRLFELARTVERSQGEVSTVRGGL